MTDINIIRGQHVKKGDEIPTLRLKLVEDGSPYNLENHDVTFKMKRTDEDSLKIDGSNRVTVESPRRGIVTYNWQSSDTDTTGTYLIECIVENTNNSQQATFPSNGYERIYIEERL